MADDRINRLSQRFKSHAAGRAMTPARSRERKSFYLDAELVERLDQTYREINHQLYPKAVSKSAFLETLIEFGLDHLTDLKAALSQASEQGDTTH